MVCNFEIATKIKESEGFTECWRIYQLVGRTSDQVRKQIKTSTRSETELTTTLTVVTEHKKLNFVRVADKVGSKV